MGNKRKKEKHRHNKNKELKSFNKSKDDEEQILMKTETIEKNVDDHISNKRDYEEDEPDMKEQPHRKKKKKPLVVPADIASSDKKGKKSIRQMKREKFALRQAEATALSKDQLKSQSLNYLSQWKHDRQNWKFMKVKQLWLFKNKFTNNLVPDASWPVLLEYFNSAKGNIRNMLLEDANKVIKNMDDWIESQKENNSNDDNEEESTKNEKPDEISYKRARDLIQCLEE